MTCGIYALYWEDQDKIYIGQSQNLHTRSNAHFSLLKRNRHTNSKLQQTYNKYGMPSYLILEEVQDLDNITNREVYWVNEFDAIKQGLNVLDPKRTLYGTSSGRSKYSKNTILKVFSMLYNSKVAYSYISDRLKVPYTLIRDIKTQVSHVWLSHEYPDEYSVMLDRPISKTKRRYI